MVDLKQLQLEILHGVWTKLSKLRDSKTLTDAELIELTENMANKMMSVVEASKAKLKDRK
jgi:ribonuclease HIII